MYILSKKLFQATTTKNRSKYNSKK